MSVHGDQAARDTADLERFGYKQELKRELHTEHSVLVQLKQLHGFPTNSTVETIVDSDDKIAQQDSTGTGELRFALSSGKLVIH